MRTIKSGLEKDHVQKTLDVEGSGYFSGHLRRATSLMADSFSINSMQLSSSQGLSIEGDIFLIDGDENDRQSMVWTDENLTVVYGQIEGDGSQLVDVGQGADAFKPGLLFNPGMLEITPSLSNVISRMAVYWSVTLPMIPLPWIGSIMICQCFIQKPLVTIQFLQIISWRSR